MDVQVISNAGKAAAGLGARVKALRDLRPVLASIAGDVDLLTAEAFSKSRSVQGEAFPPLTEAAQVARLRQRKGAFRKAMGSTKARVNKLRRARAKGLKTGDYSDWMAIRQNQRDRLDAALAASSFKPLINTGRMRASAGARVVNNTTVRFAIVDYAMPHITGGKKRTGARSKSIYARMASRLDAGKDGNPPQRNPTVFRVVDGRWLIDPKLAADIVVRIQRHVGQAVPS